MFCCKHFVPCCKHYCSALCLKHTLLTRRRRIMDYATTQSPIVHRKYSNIISLFRRQKRHTASTHSSRHVWRSKLASRLGGCRVPRQRPNIHGPRRFPVARLRWLPHATKQHAERREVRGAHARFQIETNLRESRM